MYIAGVRRNAFDRSVGYKKKRSNVKVFNFLDSLSSEFTYTRNDTCATYVDKNGKLRLSSANSPRFNHSSNGTALGLLFELSRQNKCTNYNANPTDTTGWTINSGTGTITVVDDATELANAKLDLVCTTGKVFKLDNTGQATTFLVYAPGTVGNLNPHSVSVYARGTGVGVRTGRLFLANTSIDIATGGTYARYKLENITPDSTSRRLAINVDAGDIVYVILNQLEEAVWASSPIVTVGAAATRQKDRVYLTTLATRPWFDETKGFFALNFIPERTYAGNQYPVVASNNSTAQTIGMRLGDGTTHYMRGYVRASSTIKNQSANYMNNRIGLENFALITWKSGESVMCCNGCEAFETGYTGDPTGLTHLEVGGRAGGSEGFIGHIKRLVVGKTYSVSDAGRYSNIGELISVGAGQSLMENKFTAIEDASPAGAENFISVIEGITGRRHIFAGGAYGGSALLEASVGTTNYWYNDVTLSFDGDASKKFLRVVNSLGNRAISLGWSQGESDASAITLGEITKARYKAGLLALFTWMWSLVGEVPIVIEPLGRRSDSAGAQIGYQAIREVQHELAQEHALIHLAPEKFDLPLYDETGSTDGVHMSKTSSITYCAREARYHAHVLGYSVPAAEPPVISSALRSGTSITVTLAQSSGTDFTPSSSIAGFKFFDNASEITISSAVRTNASTITLTLNSAPTSGIEKLYYGYGVMLTDNEANFVKDNTANTLPLQSKVITL